MSKRGRPRHPDILTPREWEVLDLLRAGLSNDEIGRRLGITERTAKYHVSEILSKLGVANRSEAAAWQPEQGQPWWATAAAPIGFISRNTSVSGLSSVAAGSVLLVALGGLALLAFLLLRNDQGEGVRVVDGAGAYEHMVFSFRGNIYTVRPDGSDLQRIIGPDDAFYSAPQFSPDGRQIVFLADRRRVVIVDAADPTEAIADINLYRDFTPPTPIASDWSMGPTAVHWSPDGAQLLVTVGRLGGSGATDIVVMNPDGSNQRTILESGLFVEGTWWHEEDNVYIAVAAGNPDLTTALYDLDGNEAGFALPDPATRYAVASVQHPEGGAALVRGTLGNREPFRPIEVADVDGSRVIGEGCGATWSPDGTRIAFYNGEALVLADPDGDAADLEMIVSNADLALHEPTQVQSADGLSTGSCSGLAISWAANATVSSKAPARGTTSEFVLHSDGNFDIAFEMPDSWEADAPWMPYFLCATCLVVGPTGVTPPHGVTIYEVHDISESNCPEFPRCIGRAQFFSTNRKYFDGDEREVVAGDYPALQQRTFVQPPLGLWNETGDFRLYHQIETVVKTPREEENRGLP